MAEGVLNFADRCKVSGGGFFFFSYRLCNYCAALHKYSVRSCLQ